MKAFRLLSKYRENLNSDEDLNEPIDEFYVALNWTHLGNFHLDCLCRRMRNAKPGDRLAIYETDTLKRVRI